MSPQLQSRHRPIQHLYQGYIDATGQAVITSQITSCCHRHFTDARLAGDRGVLDKAACTCKGPS